MEDLKRDEDHSIFPPRFIINITKKSGCNSCDLNSKITVTLFKFEETKAIEPVYFQLFVPTFLFIKYYATNVSGRHHCPIPSHQCELNLPKLSDLIRYSKKISGYWKEIAVLLGIEDKIAAIDIDNQHTEKKCFDMFTTWLERTINPCWCHFIQALYDVRLDNIAEDAAPHIVTLRTPVAETVQSLTTNIQKECIPAKKLKLLVAPSGLKVNHLELQKSNSVLHVTDSSISKGSSKIENDITVGLNSVAGELEITHVKLHENENTSSGINSSITEAKSHLQCVSDTDNVRMLCSADISENTSKIVDETLNLHELKRYLMDIPECDLIYFATRLLPKDRATEVIKDIRRHGGSKEDKLSKICQVFLQEKDPSWKKIYDALKKAKCDDLADLIETCFFSIENLPSS